MTELEQRLAVAAEARTWLGTKYHHAARIKGVGVDCAQILIAVYAAVGLIKSFKTEPYPPDWHLHRSVERYLGWVQKFAHPVERAGLGDLMVFKFGRCFAHGGIVVGDGIVVHSYIGRGVILSRLQDDPLIGRQTQHWSLW